MKDKMREKETYREHVVRDKIHKKPILLINNNHNNGYLYAMAWLHSAYKHPLIWALFIYIVLCFSRWIAIIYCDPLYAARSSHFQYNIHINYIKY